MTRNIVYLGNVAVDEGCPRSPRKSKPASAVWAVSPQGATMMLSAALQRCRLRFGERSDDPDRFTFQPDPQPQLPTWQPRFW